MTTNTTTLPNKPSPALSLYHLLDPEVLADPYPLYHRLRTESPVHWDPYLHAWVVTRYADVITVLHDFSADRTPTPEQFAISREVVQRSEEHTSELQSLTNLVCRLLLATKKKL